MLFKHEHSIITIVIPVSLATEAAPGGTSCLCTVEPGYPAGEAYFSCILQGSHFSVSHHKLKHSKSVFKSLPLPSGSASSWPKYSHTTPPPPINFTTHLTLTHREVQPERPSFGAQHTPKPNYALLPFQGQCRGLRLEGNEGTSCFTAENQPQ